MAALFRFDLITLFLLLGAVVLIAFWMRMRRSGKNLASALSRLGKQQSAPAPQQVSASTRVREGMRDVTQITRNAQNLKNGSSAAQAGISRSAPEPVEQVTSNRKAPTPPTDRRTERSSSNPDTAANNPVTSTAAATTTAPERLQTRMKKGAKTAVELGALAGTAAATGGTSLAATGGKAAAVAGSASKAAKAAKIARTAHTRVNQVKVAVQEGTQRAGRTTQNHELRRTLSRSQNADLTTEAPPSFAPTNPRASAAGAAEKRGPAGGRQVKGPAPTPSPSTMTATTAAAATPGREGTEHSKRSSKPDAPSSRNEDKKTPARASGQATPIDRMRERLRELSGQ